MFMICLFKIYFIASLFSFKQRNDFYIDIGQCILTKYKQNMILVTQKKFIKNYEHMCCVLLTFIFCIYTIKVKLEKWFFRNHKIFSHELNMYSLFLSLSKHIPFTTGVFKRSNHIMY